VKTAIRGAAIALFLASLTTVSVADTLDIPAQRTVKFGDLNLGTNSGLVLLYGRIRSAAREVCEPETIWNVQALLETKDCMDRAIERAVDDVNDPLLKSYHLSQTHASSVAQQ